MSELGILSLIGTIYVYVKSIADSQTFATSFKNVAGIKINLWIVVVIVISVLIVTIGVLKRVNLPSRILRKKATQMGSLNLSD
ncbi:hypothetical protein [Pedobacter alluvionis]|uniref:Uncharacterized protein n=1 Tax=Pedobacter alluvionis TaxID=475253 RepID=A0ABY2HRW9_9SPHI|nr:hypothetical protein [Pedobacter alluvionis]TFB32693.1 hypothetical protein E3V97_01255 [Pedobacter alluvionis]